jgi:hypothetical protein
VPSLEVNSQTFLAQFADETNRIQSGNWGEICFELVPILFSDLTRLAMDETKSIKRSFNPNAPIVVGFFLLAAAAIMGYVVYLAFGSSRDQREKQIAKQAGVNQKGGENQLEVKRIDPAVVEEQRVIAQVRMQGIRTVHREIAESLDKLETDVIAWETRLPELMNGDTGKRIAANKIRVDQFAGVLERKRASRSQVRDFRERMDLLIKPIDKAMLDPASAYYASESLVGEIQRVGDEVRIALREIREIKTIVDTLQADSMGEAPAKQSLQAVLDDIRAVQLRKRIESIAKLKQSTYEEETKRLAEAEAKVEKDIAAARKAVLDAQTDLDLQGIRQRTDALLRQRQEEAEAEKKRVEKLNRIAKFEAEYPAMQAYLVPMTSPGLKQFEGNWLRLTSKKGPLSFGGLKGQLTKSENASFQFARNIYSENDRPHGAFPYLSTGGAGCTPENYEILFRIQDFIAEFGDIMVERKLLAP